MKTTSRLGRTFRWVLLLLLGLPVLSQAQFSYVTNNGTITITGFTGGGDWTVPGMIDGLLVTAIAEGTFQNNTNLNVLRIPNSVTNLGASAFSGCISLYGVVMPSYLPNIGDNTFSNCFQLTGLTIPAGVTNIGRGAFFSCSSLLHIEIPDTVTTVQDGAFETDWRLKNVTFGNGMVSIGEFAFAGCRGLTSVSFGTNLQNIGHGAFNSCSNLASLTLPKSVTNVDSQAFAFCIGLQTVYFIGNAPSTSEDVFLGDTITFVDYLPQTTGWEATFGGAPAVLWNPQTLAPGAGAKGFGFTITGNTSLSVVVEASTDLAQRAWMPVGTNTLALRSSLFSDSDWTNFNSRFYRLRPAAPVPFFCLVTNGEVMITGYRGTGGTVTIPDYINGLPVTGIGSYMFDYFSGYSPSSVSSVVLGSNVRTIAPRAFADANYLTNVVLDSALTSIGSEAFLGAFNLSNIFIPAAVTNIDAGAFLYCASLVAFDVDATNSAYSTLDGVLLNKSQTTLVAFPEGKAGPYVIPMGVTNIVAQAFEYCTALTSVAVPDTVQAIEDSAFLGCGGLTYLNLPASLASLGTSAFEGCNHLRTATIGGGTVGDNAFHYCNSLTIVILGTNVTSIGSNAFSGCALTSVTIPWSVTNIGAMPFSDNASLNYIAVDPFNPAYQSVNGVLFDKAQTTLIEYPAAKAGNYVIPATVTRIGDGAFMLCWGLTNMTIPATVQYLGQQAFYYCLNLTSVALPNTITNIANGAFEDCSSLTNIILGTNIIGIGPYAFANCLHLPSITLPGSVTQIEPGAFANCQALRTMTLGNRVASVGDEAFDDCHNLSKVIIESSWLDIGSYAFGYCQSLSAIYFTGNAPSADINSFSQTSATVYYMPGTIGWGPTLAGLPTVLWNPQIVTSAPGFGIGTNGFGFVIAGSSNLTIVVEASTDMVHPVWQPLSTNALVDGASIFSDPSWTNFPSRFYRLRSP